MFLSGEELRGKVESFKISEQFDEEYQRMIDLKNEAGKSWLRKKTWATEEIYIEQRWTVTKGCQKKKGNNEERVKTLVHRFQRKQTHKLCSKIKTEKRGLQPRVNIEGIAERAK